MNFLLDTNILSEWVKPKPDSGVVEWLLKADENRLFISVISLGEIRCGIEQLALGAKRKRLLEWLEDELMARFHRRIIDVDRKIAEQWGICIAKSRKSGIALDTMDAFFAATAIVHRLTLITRNTRDFRQTGLRLMNPWHI